MRGTGGKCGTSGAEGKSWTSRGLLAGVPRTGHRTGRNPSAAAIQIQIPFLHKNEPAHVVTEVNHVPEGKINAAPDLDARRIRTPARTTTRRRRPPTRPGGAAGDATRRRARPELYFDPPAPAPALASARAPGAVPLVHPRRYSALGCTRTVPRRMRPRQPRLVAGVPGYFNSLSSGARGGEQPPLNPRHQPAHRWQRIPQCRGDQLPVVPPRPLRSRTTRRPARSHIGDRCLTYPRPVRRQRGFGPSPTGQRMAARRLDPPGTGRVGDSADRAAAPARQPRCTAAPGKPSHQQQRPGQPRAARPTAPRQLTASSLSSQGVRELVGEESFRRKLK